MPSSTRWHLGPELCGVPECQLTTSRIAMRQRSICCAIGEIACSW